MHVCVYVVNVSFNSNHSNSGGRGRGREKNKMKEWMTERKKGREKQRNFLRKDIKLSDKPQKGLEKNKKDVETWTSLLVLSCLYSSSASYPYPAVLYVSWGVVHDMVPWPLDTTGITGASVESGSNGKERERERVTVRECERGLAWEPLGHRNL